MQAVLLLYSSAVTAMCNQHLLYNDKLEQKTFYYRLKRKVNIAAPVEPTLLLSETQTVCS